MTVPKFIEDKFMFVFGEFNKNLDVLRRLWYNKLDIMWCLN